MLFRSFAALALTTLTVCGSCQTKSAQNPTGGIAPPFKVTVTLIAGDSTQFGSTDNADPLKARFSFPKKLVWDDGTQSLFIADGSGAGRIRKMDKAGQVTTPLPYVGTSNDIHDICLVPNKTGTMYFGTTMGELVKYKDGGQPEIIIDWRRNNGTRKAGNETGSLDAAAVSGPNGIVAAPNGDVYFANDYYKTLHKINFKAVDNEVTAFAGKPTGGVSASAFNLADGKGIDATFGAINDMAIDDDGNIYVADAAYCTVRKITPGGLVSSLLTPSSSTYTYYLDKDGPVALARASKVAHVAVSNDGNLVFFATAGAVRLIRADKEVTTLAKFKGGVSGIACTPDGKTVYLTCRQAIYQLDLR